jgi:membrane-bound lytic murein transglycosylase B
MAKIQKDTVMTAAQYFRPVRAAVLICICIASPALAATCSDTSQGYDAWKSDFAAEAAAEGVGTAGLNALAGTSYSKTTIGADRNQKSFKYPLDQFLQVRGANDIASIGKSRRAKNKEFYDSLEAAFGVPAGILIAIHGMETGFGNFMGDTNIVSAIATLTFDCRRSDFFRPHLIGALRLIDQGSIDAGSIGAKHGELGHTQFLPGNAFEYGIDGNGDGQIDLNNAVDALASTANYLRAKGWQAGVGYSEGQPNFAVLNEWNAATVYQQAIALIAAKIDG